MKQKRIATFCAGQVAAVDGHVVVGVTNNWKSAAGPQYIAQFRAGSALKRQVAFTQAAELDAIFAIDIGADSFRVIDAGRFSRSVDLLLLGREEDYMTQVARLAPAPDLEAKQVQEKE